VEGINLPGWHLHFLSEDKYKEGTFWRLLLFRKKFQLMLPSGSSFASMDISEDRREETQTIEGAGRP
jgi:acetolactate decarboxylase